MINAVVTLAKVSATYTGKALAYSGKVIRSGSDGEVTYAYYSDSACKKEAKAANVKAAVGAKTYVRVASGSSKWLSAVNKKTGAITVKAGAPKGKTQSVKVKVTASGNGNYKSLSKTITVKVKVK